MNGRYLSRWISMLMLLGSTMVLAQDLPLNVDKGKTSEENIFGYKQTIYVEGIVADDVDSIGGDVHIKGTVEGSVTVLGADIMIYEEGRVDGNIVCLGGNVRVTNRQASVGGQITNLFNPSKDERAPLFGSTYAQLAFFFAHVLVLFMLVVGIFYTFPNQVSEAGFELSQDLVRAAIIGAVTWAVGLLLLFLSFLLMVVAVGFPMLLLTVTALLVINLFGSVIVFFQLGLALENLSKSMLNLGLALLAVIILASLLVYVPLLGQLFVVSVLLFGSGIVIDTRFGTNKQWFTRKARYWSAD